MRVKGMLAIASGALIIFACKSVDIQNEFVEAILLVVSIVNISVGVYLTKGILGRK